MTLMVFLVGIPVASEVFTSNSSYIELLYQRRFGSMIKEFLLWFLIGIIVYGMIILGMIWTRPDIWDSYLGRPLVLVIILTVVYFIFSAGKVILDFGLRLSRCRISAGI